MMKRARFKRKVPNYHEITISKEYAGRITKD
jgi:hypothetical protein